MKKVGIAGIICILMVAGLIAVQSCQVASAQEYRKQIGNKAERGVKNVLFGWTEIPRRIVDITKESRNPLWGVVAGAYQGTCKAFARTASGVIDVATCGVRSDEKPFMQPDMDVQ